MTITRLGSWGLPASCPSPNISEIQGTDLAETQEQSYCAKHCSPPSSPEPSSRADGGGPPNGTQNSLELHTVSAKVGEGSRRGGLALGQARQEGGGGGGILRPPEDLASANLGVGAKGGEGDGHPGHLSLRGLARRHLGSEEGPSCTATLWPGPRGEARPRAARPRVARRGGTPRWLPPLRRGAPWTPRN